MEIVCHNCGCVAMRIGLRDEFAGILGRQERRIVNILLMAEPGAFVPSRIITEIIGIADGNVREYIRRIRRKLGDEAIDGKQGYGYRWVGPAEPLTQQHGASA